MDNRNLLELKNRLAALPVLKDRQKRLQTRISEAQADVDALLRKYEKESLDVERIEKESLSTTLLKLFGRYEGRVEKEMQEMVHAKTRYDAATIRLRELESEALNLNRRIADLVRDKQSYEKELERREAILRRNLSDESAQAYKKLCEEGERLSRQLAETQEALRAAERAYDTAQDVLKHLDDAEGWASVDVWFSKGLFSHMAKYDRIDSAEEALERLNTQLDELRRELDDIDLDFGLRSVAINSSTRFFDVWFDNIFTDLRVRDQIRGYQSHAGELCEKLEQMIFRLKTAVKDLKEALKRVEKQQEEIILSFEADR